MSYHLQYTTEEDAIIRNNYKKLSYKEISKLLNRNYRSVRDRALKLGLQKRNRKEFTNEEDAIISNLWESHTEKEIAHILNRPKGSIWSRAQLLCLGPKMNIYIVYRGDQLLCRGTVDECAAAAGVTPLHIRRLLSDSHKVVEQTYKETNKRLYVCRLDKEELA